MWLFKLLVTHHFIIDKLGELMKPLGEFLLSLFPRQSMSIFAGGYLLMKYTTLMIEIKNLKSELCHYHCDSVKEMACIVIAPIKNSIADN